jgi:hypothetical protein
MGRGGGGKNSFNTKFVYDHLTSGDAGAPFKHIWSARLRYKIKIFS